ncbi:variant erythrocyte surface antigen-1 family protein [Babesia caballi]|uniref:Variant erythrocyte surface antigen-1 family protein n=1 Tax=Babesia caballi TaxID=5871 RepID=A0AAV4LMQ9_BABCB|nr:variant erythrocyte surface antigen-1 family protein [Babesia caballi]
MTSLDTCPSNLKEAIDWILRVTGKDGQDTGGTGALSNAVTHLLGDIHPSEPELQKKFETIKGALNSSPTGLIDHLANGLAKFIGYEDNNNNGLIGVGGIAVSNDPLERLRDGVLGFLAGFVGMLNHRTYQTALKLTQFSAKISEAVTALNGGVGKGRHEFEKAISKAGNALKGVKANGIDKVWSALKNVNNLKDDSSQLPKTFQAYVKKVLEAVENDQMIKQAQAQSQVKGGEKVNAIVQELNGEIRAVLQQFNNMGGRSIDLGNSGLQPALSSLHNSNMHLHPSQVQKLQHQAKALASAVYNGTSHFLAQLRRRYVMTKYEAPKPDAITPVHARIFLGCVPLYYYGVTYLYWRCSGDNGWTALTFNGGRGGFDLKWFMQAMGFEPSLLNVNMKGSEFVSTAFKGFNSSLTSDSKSSPRYFTFLSQLQNKVVASVSDLTRCSLFCLYNIAETYFRHLQSLKAENNTAFPQTIRAILYWMAGLQFSPDYDYLLGHISNIFMNILNIPSTTKDSEPTLQIADSAWDSSQSLTPSYVKGYLVATCLYIPSLLSSIQGAEKPVPSDEPFLHKLYSNDLSLHYPSGAALFNALCDYVYAIQFEFSFLYHMCATAYSYGYGWLYCWFGERVHPVKDPSTPVLSHLCAGYTCKGVSGCTHNRNVCGHDTGGQGVMCGKSSSQPSPLQAFLTDKLTGFCLKLPGSSKHMKNHPPGYMCHVPMGFDGHIRADAKQGGNLNYTLQPFCGGSTSPLRQLGEKLLCISRRTPKTLADLFGFYWNLNRVWEKKVIESESLKQLIEGTVECTIASIFAQLNATEMLSTAIGNLKGHCHAKAEKTNVVTHKTPQNSDHDCKDTPADLWSLCESVTIAERHKDCRAAKCGGYLYPLTLSTGAAFGISAFFASTYLSWIFSTNSIP